MFGKIVKLLLFGMTLNNSVFLASAITIGYSAGEGSESVSSSIAYDLDDSTSLEGITILNGASIVQDQKASGSGNNSISQSIAGSGYSIKNSIENNGSFNALASVEAVSNMASYVQSISGEGDTKAKQILLDSDNRLKSEVDSFGALSISSAATASQGDSTLDQNVLGVGYSSISLIGIQGPRNVLQQASISNGLLKSTQKAKSGQEISLRQETSMDGEEGIVGTCANDQDNYKIAFVRFDDEGKADSKLESTVAENADISGEISLNGVTWIDDKTLEQTGSEYSGIDIQGLIEAKDGDIGNFQVASASGKYQNQVYYGNHYALKNYRLNRKDPKVTFELNPKNLPLDKQATINSIGWAAWTWDAGVWDYAGAETVLFDIPNYNVITNENSEKSTSNDGFNVIGWRNLEDSSVIAYAQNYVNEDPYIGGYWNIAESDLVFNTGKKWSNSPQSRGSGTYDVRALALHELGHALGLADLYGSGDKEQVMYGYNAYRRELNDGDIAGLKKLYDWRPVALRSDNGQQVVAEDGGGQVVNANRPWIGEWEKFELIPAWPGWGEDKYVLRASNGQFACAENGGGRELVANRDNAREWETFGVENLGSGNIALKSYNGQWVCAENGGGRELIANRDRIGPWETFKVSQLRSYPWTEIRSVGNNKYVCAENAGNDPLVSNRDIPKTWEGFDLVPLTSDTIAIRSKANGKYVCAENGGGRELIANRDWIGSWETFTFKNLGRDDRNFPMYTLKAFNGQYVRVDPNRGNKLYADVYGSAGGWEKFAWSYNLPRAS